MIYTITYFEIGNELLLQLHVCDAGDTAWSKGGSVSKAARTAARAKACMF